MYKLELANVYDVSEGERNEANPTSKLTSRDSFCTLRPSREDTNKSSNKITQYYFRTTKEETDIAASSSSSSVMKRDTSTKPCDVYISSRFNESGPTEERKKLVQNLEKFGIKVAALDSESTYNESIESTICRDMTAAKMIILMVTDDYASAESSSSSSDTNRITTREELEFVIETQKPFYLLKLCRNMPPSTAKLPVTSAYASWPRGGPAPSGLTETLLKKIDRS